jgi:hypothetical protein
MDIIEYNFRYISVNIVDHDQVRVGALFGLALPHPSGPPFENAG